jgi:hypothetical protein
MDGYYRVRLVVDHNTIYMLCDQPPACNDPNDPSKGFTFSFSSYEFEAMPLTDGWRITYVDWTKVSLISYRWVDFAPLDLDEITPR